MKTIELETILIDEKEVVKRYLEKVNDIRKRGLIYKADLESRYGINTEAYLHEFGNAFWREAASLDDNINYLISLCTANYSGGMFALCAQLKAEKERDLFELFIVKAGLADAFSQYKQAYKESGKNPAVELLQLASKSEPQHEEN